MQTWKRRMIGGLCAVLVVTAALTGPRAARADPAPPALWSSLPEDKADPQQLTLDKIPADSTIRIGETFGLKAMAGSAGYLVILELNTEDHLSVLAPVLPDPASPTPIPDAPPQGIRVRAGTIVPIPDPASGRTFTVNQPGTEHVRGVLFSSREDAARLIHAIQSGKMDAFASQQSFVTASLTFMATPASIPPAPPTPAPIPPAPPTPAPIPPGPPTPAPVPPDPANVPTLQMMPLKDGGGLADSDPGSTYPAELTTEIVKRLTDFAKDRCKIVLSASDPQPSARYRIEGDVSHVSTGTGAQGPYCLNLRLFKTGTPEVLIHQWAGYAPDLPSMTSNAAHDPAIDGDGLAGEIAHRVIAAVTAARPGGAARQIAMLVDVEAQLNRISTRIIPASQPSADAPGAPSLHSGDRYRIQVESKDSGVVYLVGVGPDGRPVSLYVPPDAENTLLAPGTPAVLPPGDGFLVNDVQSPEDLKIVVLVRRRDPNLPLTAAPSAPATAAAPIVGDGSRIQILDSGGPEAAVTGTGQDDAGVLRILAMAASDPPGTWLAQRITIHVEPKP